MRIIHYAERNFVTVSGEINIFNMVSTLKSKVTINCDFVEAQQLNEQFRLPNATRKVQVNSSCDFQTISKSTACWDRLFNR